MASALVVGEEDFGGHKHFDMPRSGIEGEATVLNQFNRRGFGEWRTPRGGLYLVAANTALEVGEFGTNQVNMLIYKKGRLLSLNI